MGELDAIALELAAKDAAWPVMPILMARVDSGEIVYATPAVAETFGYTPRELVGKQVEMLVPRTSREIHAAARVDVMESAARLMGGNKYRIIASGKTTTGRVVHGVKKDGTVFPSIITLTSARVFGDLIGIAIVVDISPMVEAAP